jgi:thiol-disulfide isomerase/thioredoxin
MNRREYCLKSISYILLAGQAPGLRSAQTPLPFDAASPATLLKAHAGKPFILALWSVYCEPCRDEMAVWAAVRRKHPSLPIELVSTDAPADRALIDTFLAKWPPGPVRHWIFADAFTERVRYAVDKSWRGELPRSYFYDAAHKPTIKSGKVDQTWIESWLAGSMK